MKKAMRLTVLVLVLLLTLGTLPASARPRTAPDVTRFLPKLVTQVRILPKTARLLSGTSLQLSAQLRPESKDAPILWSVASGADVVSVDEKGRVTALKPGVATIKATHAESGRFALRRITVKAVRVQKVTLSKSALVLDVNEESDALKGPMVLPANATNRAVSFRSTNPNVVSVTQEGVMTGLRVGTSTIIATADGRSASCRVRVRGKSTHVTLSAVGDVILGGDPLVKSALSRSTEATFAQLIAQYGTDYPFKNVENVFRADDITIVNLEGTLTTATKTNPKKPHAFRGLPAYAGMLKGAGVEVCNLANNHSLDFGGIGLRETQRSLTSAGVKWTDFKTDTIYTLKKDGMTIKIGFAGWQTPTKLEDMSTRVRLLKKQCDVVVATFHWCDTPEWTAKNYASDRVAARAAIVAGADLVLGHHRHIPSGIEQYRGKYIVFDLSNFIVGIKHKADATGRPLTDSLIFQWRFRIDEGGYVEDAGIKVIPCTTTTSSETYPATDGFGNLGAPVNNWQPAILTGTQGKEVLARIQAMSTVNLSPD
ncbi:MAG: CapA family protein [Clostridia bacterium]